MKAQVGRPHSGNRLRLDEGRGFQLAAQLRPEVLTRWLRQACQSGAKLIGGLFKLCRIRKLSEQLWRNLGIVGKIHPRNAEYGARIAALQRRDMGLELRSLAIILTQLRDRQKIVFKGAALKNPKQADRMAFLLRQPFQGQLQRGDQAFRRSLRRGRPTASLHGGWLPGVPPAPPPSGF